MILAFPHFHKLPVSGGLSLLFSRHIDQQALCMESHLRKATLLSLTPHTIPPTVSTFGCTISPFLRILNFNFSHIVTRGKYFGPFFLQDRHFLTWPTPVWLLTFVTTSSQTSLKMMMLKMMMPVRQLFSTYNNTKNYLLFITNIARIANAVKCHS